MILKENKLFLMNSFKFNIKYQIRIKTYDEKNK